MTDVDLTILVSRHGVGAKLVRAVCKANGWRHRPGDNGAPREWYEAFRGELGGALERVLMEATTPAAGCNATERTT